MAERRQQRGRGVLAGLLRMSAGGAEQQRTQYAEEPLGEPVPGPISSEMREAYEPGWYRISLARSEREPGEETESDSVPGIGVDGRVRASGIGSTPSPHTPSRPLLPPGGHDPLRSSPPPPG